MSDNPIQLLTEPASGEDERLAALHAALVTRASAESSLDVTYRLLDSPVGPLLLAATENGVVRVAFEIEDHDRVLESLGSSVGSRILRGGVPLDPLARELDDYFAGRRQGFDVPLDLRLARGFRLTVLRHLGEIPYGSTESYGEVAVASGSPRAVRAVGSRQSRATRASGSTTTIAGRCAIPARTARTQAAYAAPSGRPPAEKPPQSRPGTA